MSRKLKGSPRRRLTASNLLVAHVAFHVLFVFGYWFSVAASLSFSDPSFFENHLLALLTNASSNHLALLLALGIHTIVVVAHRWRKRRQQGGAIRQFDSQLSHLTAEEKLELLLDEVAELREGLNERDAVKRSRIAHLATERLRNRDMESEDEMNLLDENQAERAAKRS